MKRNPYNFGALAGYAQIYVRLRYYERALAYSRCALKVNPNMNGVSRNIDLIEHLLEQRRRQMIRLADIISRLHPYLEAHFRGCCLAFCDLREWRNPTDLCPIADGLTSANRAIKR